MITRKNKLSAGTLRLNRCRTRGSAIFPVATVRALLPRDYAEALAKIKDLIERERLRTIIAANAAMVSLYWEIGREILNRQVKAGWGAGIIDRLAIDLRDSFPDMKGFSPRNLKYMRALASAWPDKRIVQRSLHKLPWGQNIALLEKLSTMDERLWYAHQTMEHGWSRPILEMQIASGLRERHGKAVTNFPLTLPPAKSDMAAQVFKDPYLFDFLGTADPRREAEVEQALVDHLQKYLLELGSGFAFVGRQVHLEVDDQDFNLDLLFYHLKLRCYVVIEFKAVPFEPEFVGKLNFYLSAVDDLLKHPDDSPTIGLLLCRSKKRLVVEYALRDLKKPVGVAQWETRIVKSLPKEFKGSLPSIEELEKELRDEK